MPTASFMAGLRVILVIAMMIGIVPYSSHTVVPHRLAIASAAADVAGDHHHGHSHDRDDGDSADAGKAAHDPADHAYETLAMTTVIVMVGRATPDRWSAAAAPEALPNPPLPLDRPPRPRLAA